MFVGWWSVGGGGLCLCGLLARTHCSSLFEGMGVGAEEVGETEEDEYGMRKGSAPVGEAWLLEDSTRKSTPASLRKVYT